MGYMTDLCVCGGEPKQIKKQRSNALFSFLFWGYNTFISTNKMFYQNEEYSLVCVKQPCNCKYRLFNDRDHKVHYTCPKIYTYYVIIM